MLKVDLNGEIGKETDVNNRESYKKRNKYPLVDLHKSAFTIDRQLEDQKYLIQYNNNPRLLDKTKAEVIRSNTYNKPNELDDSALHHKVINQIVREAAGVLDYNMIFTRVTSDNDSNYNSHNKSTNHKIIYPEINPVLRPYAKEIMTKSSSVTFGHRPSSASRVFNPSTMSIRLHHNEILEKPKKPIGLPVTILQRLLNMPKLPLADLSQVLPEQSTDSKLHSQTDSHIKKLLDPYELFNNSTSTWVSKDTTQRMKSKRKLKPIKSNNESINDDDKPHWNDSFGRKDHIDLPFKDKHDLNKPEKIPFEQRLTRFNALAASSESQLLPFCVEKQQTDRYIQHNKVYNKPINKLKPIDPSSTHINTIIKDYKQHQLALQSNYQTEAYQQLVNHTIQDANQLTYYSTTELAKLRKSKLDTELDNHLDDKVDSEIDNLVNSEINYKNALKEATKGNKIALHKYYKSIDTSNNKSSTSDTSTISTHSTINSNHSSLYIPKSKYPKVTSVTSYMKSVHANANNNNNLNLIEKLESTIDNKMEDSIDEGIETEQDNNESFRYNQYINDILDHSNETNDDEDIDSLIDDYLDDNNMATNESYDTISGKLLDDYMFVIDESLNNSTSNQLTDEFIQSTISPTSRLNHYPSINGNINVVINNSKDDSTVDIRAVETTNTDTDIKPDNQVENKIDEQIVISDNQSDINTSSTSDTQESVNNKLDIVDTQDQSKIDSEINEIIDYNISISRNNDLCNKLDSNIAQKDVDSKESDRSIDNKIEITNNVNEITNLDNESVHDKQQLEDIVTSYSTNLIDQLMSTIIKTLVKQKQINNYLTSNHSNKYLPDDPTDIIGKSIYLSIVSKDSSNQPIRTIQVNSLSKLIDETDKINSNTTSLTDYTSNILTKINQSSNTMLSPNHKSFIMRHVASKTPIFKTRKSALNYQLPSKAKSMKASIRIDNHLRSPKRNKETIMSLTNNSLISTATFESSVATSVLDAKSHSDSTIDNKSISRDDSTKTPSVLDNTLSIKIDKIEVNNNKRSGKIDMKIITTPSNKNLSIKLSSPLSTHVKSPINLSNRSTRGLSTYSSSKLYNKLVDQIGTAKTVSSKNISNKSNSNTSNKAKLLVNQSGKKTNNEVDTQVLGLLTNLSTKSVQSNKLSNDDKRKSIINDIVDSQLNDIISNLSKK